MSYMAKRRWDTLTNNSSLGSNLCGGSAPYILSPPRSEGPGKLQERLSMEVLRGWASDLGSLSKGLNLNLSPVKWPPLVTVCGWKKTLAEKLKRRHGGTEEDSQVRELAGVIRWRLTDGQVKSFNHIWEIIFWVLLSQYFR